VIDVEAGRLWWITWRLKGARHNDLWTRYVPMDALLTTPRNIFPIEEWEAYWDLGDFPKQGTPEAPLEWMLSGAWKRPRPVPPLDPALVSSGDYRLEFRHALDSTHWHDERRVGFRVHMPGCTEYPGKLPGNYVQAAGPPRAPLYISPHLVDFEEAMETLRNRYEIELREKKLTKKQTVSIPG